MLFARSSSALSAPPLIGRWVPFVAVAAANCINIPMMRLQEIQKGVPVLDSNSNVLGESTAAAKQGIALVTLSRLGMAMPGMEDPRALNSAAVSSGAVLEMSRPGLKTSVYTVHASSYDDMTQRAVSGYVFRPLGDISPNCYRKNCNKVHVLTPIVMNWLEQKKFLIRYRWAAAPIQVGLVGLCLTFATPMCCALFSQKAAIPVSSLEPELQERINKLPSPPEVVYYNKGL
uniref:Uncharacterized protein n=1 Tax=Timema genevievae TaxID=629358 RepID=A0A7R9K1Y8_TIMGE|nr:unnamed protein product [Timema genevievae]